MENNIIQTNAKNGETKKFQISTPWTTFLPYLQEYDEIYIESQKSKVTNNDLLVINPKFLVSVTMANEAISCPRKVYIRHLGADITDDPYVARRKVQGILIHNLFSDQIISDRSVEESVENIIEASKADLIIADYKENHARNYLQSNGMRLKSFNLSGKTEIDVQNWKYGLHGKFDGLTDKKQILELKTSKIPDKEPWPDHNLQMNAYLDIVDSAEGEYNGLLIYLNSGQLGVKTPKPTDFINTILGRNWAYLVLSGRYTPPILRGEDKIHCKRCYLKTGCYSLCAGLLQQRDCKACYHDKLCNKKEWDKSSREYYHHFVDATQAEELESNIENFQFKNIISKVEKNPVMLENSEDIIITKKKISEKKEHGIYYTSYTHKNKTTRFRYGDLVAAFSQDIEGEINFYHTVVITDIDQNNITIKSKNPLDENLIVSGKSSSTLLRRSRTALYSMLNFESEVLNLIKQSFNSTPDIKPIQYKDSMLENLLMNYNNLQLQSIKLALFTPELALIQGPAGTGKTSVIIEIVNQLLNKNQMVLVTAFTNMAVDNIALKLKEHDIEFLRIGYQHSVDPNIHEFLIENKAGYFRSVVQKQAPFVVLSTTTSIGNQKFQDLFFDYVLIDEAAQMTEPDSIMAINHGEKAVLVGDHAQLQPIVVSDEARELGLQRSLFERLVKDFPTRFIQLQEQYRMNDEILKFPNNYFYNGTLRSGTDEIANSKIDVTQITNYINSSGLQIFALKHVDNNSQINEEESILVLDIIKDLFESTDDINHTDIGIIAPFRAQVAYLREILPGFDIDTVDRFQGSEREVIIFVSTTMRDVPVLTDARRINVALTRAKKKLIVLLSNPSTKRSKTILDKLYNYGVENNIVNDINTDQIHKISDESVLHKIRQSLYENLNLPKPSPIEFRELIEDNIEFSSIYYNSIELVVTSIENRSCVICLQLLEEGIECIGCGYTYHKDELINWLEEKKKCPVCKHTLELR